MNCVPIDMLPTQGPLLPNGGARSGIENRCINLYFFLYILLKFYLKGIGKANQDVDKFVSASELQKFSITSRAQQWILCSEWVPSEWESKQLIKTSE